MEGDESDDESTLLEEEKIQGKIDYKSEIAELEVYTYGIPFGILCSLEEILIELHFYPVRLITT